MVFVDDKKAGDIVFPGGEVDLTPVCKPGSNKVTLERAVFIPDDIHAVEGGLFAEGNFDSAAGTLSSWRNAQSFWPTEQGLGPDATR